MDEASHAFTTNNTVETNIWSGSLNEDEEEDSASPKLGTRAYRERERRKKERRESREKDTMSRVIADNVRVELGLPLQPPQEQGGVTVKKEMVRKEESADEPSFR